jgi:hypothetical protein
MLFTNHDTQQMKSDPTHHHQRGGGGLHAVAQAEDKNLHKLSCKAIDVFVFNFLRCLTQELYNEG